MSWRARAFALAASAYVAFAVCPPVIARMRGEALRQRQPAPDMFFSGAPAVLHPDRSPSFAVPDAAAHTTIAVSDVGTNAVYAFTAGGKLTAKITALDVPQGLAFDSAGDLFVADTGANEILEYASDLRTLKPILNDPNQFPAGVAIAPGTELVGVTNIVSAPDGGAGSVSFYAKGATAPCVTVYNAVFTRVDFGAFDAAGNFYVDGQRYDGSFVAGVVRGGCKATTIAPLTLRNAVFFPGGVQVTPSGDIAILDQFAMAVYTYAPPVRDVLGMPRTRTPLSSLIDPIGFAFAKHAAQLWVADFGFNSPQKFIPGTLDAFAFPQGGAPRATIRGLSEPTGVAVRPNE
jgi:hypothetical protein